MQISLEIYWKHFNDGMVLRASHPVLSCSCWSATTHIWLNISWMLLLTLTTLHITIKHGSIGMWMWHTQWTRTAERPLLVASERGRSLRRNSGCPEMETRVVQTKTQDLTSDLPSKGLRLDLDSMFGTRTQSTFQEIIVSHLYFINSDVWRLMLGWAQRSLTHACSHWYQTTVTTATSSSSGTAPDVVTFGYKAFRQTANKRTATCKVCGIRINDAELHEAPENTQGRVSLSVMWKGNFHIDS